MNKKPREELVLEIRKFLIDNYRNKDSEKQLASLGVAEYLVLTPMECKSSPKEFNKELFQELLIKSRDCKKYWDALNEISAMWLRLKEKPIPVGVSEWLYGRIVGDKLCARPKRQRDGSKNFEKKSLLARAAYIAKQSGYPLGRNDASESTNNAYSIVSEAAGTLDAFKPVSYDKVKKAYQSYSLFK